MSASLDPHSSGEAARSLEDAVGFRSLQRRRGISVAPLRLGRYELLHSLGRGGMGQVFAAWDPELERRVALKVLVDATGPAATREARCLARLSHPNVVAVHEVGRARPSPASLGLGELRFIAMELVEGPSLRRWLSAAPRSWLEIVDVILAAGCGLAAMHRRGLAHGDLKPDNLLIGVDRVRVVDLGLARRRPGGQALGFASRVGSAAAEAGGPRRRAKPGSPGTGVGQGGGTLPYTAPECLVGAPAGAASDQYSLCATAWEALFGVRPFAGAVPRERLETAVGAPNRGRGRPRGLPRAVEMILRRGLALDPSARWPSVDTLLRELSAARDAPRAARRRRGLALGLAAGLGLGSWLAVAGPGAAVRACQRDGAGVASAWSELDRRRIELELATAGVAMPRSEARWLDVRLRGWAERWTGLWRGSCRGEAQRARCLEHERRRFETTLELLRERPWRDGGSEWAAAIRALVVELGAPERCLDGRSESRFESRFSGRLSRRLSGRHGEAGHGEPERYALALDSLAGIELALRAGFVDAAGEALDRFEAEFADDPDLPVAARLQAERWRVRWLAASGRLEQATRRLGAARVEAERRGLDEQRAALAIEQLELWSQRSAPAPAVEALGARLEGLLEHIDASVEQRAEATLARAAALSGEPLRAFALLEAAERRWLGRPAERRAPGRAARLRLELLVRQAELAAVLGWPTTASKRLAAAQPLADELLAAGSPARARLEVLELCFAVDDGRFEVALAGLERLLEGPRSGQAGDRLASLLPLLERLERLERLETVETRIGLAPGEAGVALQLRRTLRDHLLELAREDDNRRRAAQTRARAWALAPAPSEWPRPR